MVLYKHTQKGSLIIAVLASTALLFFFILKKADYSPNILLLMLFILLILASFISMKVLVTRENLRIQFTWGIFKKRWALSDIASVEIVRNSWYHGWGIRLWLWPYRWLYNVSGFDAVEIKLKNNKIFRIGTDQPKELAKILNELINK